MKQLVEAKLATQIAGTAMAHRERVSPTIPSEDDRL
jgi:hypothetical protein